MKVNSIGSIRANSGLHSKFLLTINPVFTNINRSFPTLNQNKACKSKITEYKLKAIVIAYKENLQF